MPRGSPAKKHPSGTDVRSQWAAAVPAAEDGSPSREGAEGGSLPVRSRDCAPARRVCGLPKRAWAAGAQVGPPGRALPSHGSPRHLSPCASPSRPAVWVCFRGSQWPGAGGGIWPLSVTLFLLRGPCSKSGPISSKPQVVFNLMPPGENPPRAEEPCLGATQDLQARGARSPGCSCLPTPGCPSPRRDSSGAGSHRSAALPVTTRGHTWCCVSLLGSRSSCEGHQRMLNARSFTGGPGATPTLWPRAPVAASSHCQLGCRLHGDVTTPCGKLIARERLCPVPT